MPAFSPLSPAPAPRSLILNADDFGLSPSVNRAIADAARFGALRSVSLFVATSYSADALERWADAADPETTSWGVHFRLTSGRPAAAPADVPLLVDETGAFRRGFLDLTKALCFGKKSARTELARQIAIELTAQLDRADELARRFGRPWVRLDSHQHIAGIPSIFSLVAEAATRRGVSLRVPLERIGNPSRIWTSVRRDSGVGLVKKAILDALSRRSRRADVERRSTVGYFGVVDSGKMARDRLIAAIESAGRVARRKSFSSSVKAVEINLHPWRSVADAAAISAEIASEGVSRADREFASSPWREREWAALTDDVPALEAAAARNGFRFDRFR